MKLEFRSVADMAATIRFHSPIQQFGLVIGIAQSGLLPATMLAAKMRLPLAICDPWGDGLFFCDEANGSPWLLVDDSTYKGTAMRTAIESIRSPSPVIPLAIYGHSDSEFPCLERIDSPRIFEWNWHRHKLIESAALDMDGVLCQDFTLREIEHPQALLMHVEFARPLWLPKHQPRAIITMRLEKHRERTEAWLKRNGVTYEHLIMYGGSMEDRTEMDEVARGEWKLDRAAEVGAEWFAESSPVQARRIGAGMPCLSTGEMRLVNRREV